MRGLGWFLLVIVLLGGGYVAGALGGVAPPALKTIAFFLAITVAGAFGGMLYTIRDCGLELPHRPRQAGKAPRIELGWIADCAYGIAGAYIAFLILPTDLLGEGMTPDRLLSTGSILNLIKILAIALVGGYGGRKLVDHALSSLAKDAKKEAKEAKEQLAQIQVGDTNALELVSRHLDAGEEAVDIADLKEAVRTASRAARLEIFKEARKTRQENWRDNKPLMERTIPIFEALIDNAAGEEYHRNHAQLAYAIKDRVKTGEPTADWERAHRELGRAIELRDRQGAKGFLMYELNRAWCGIELGKAAEEITRDLRFASKNAYTMELLQKLEPFTAWANANGVDLSSL